MILGILSVNETEEVLDLGEGTPHHCSHLPNLLISTKQSAQLGLATITLKMGEKSVGLSCWDWENRKQRCYYKEGLQAEDLE